MMDSDVYIVGEPMFTFFGKQVFNPVYYLLCFPKYILHKEIHPYLIKSADAFFWCGITAIMIVIIWSLVREIRANIRNIHGTARFATRFDLWKNGLLHRSGVICGETAEAKVIADRVKDTALHLKLIKSSRLICHTGYANTLLLAMTGDGKGVSFLIPTMLSFMGSMIIYDPKGENFNTTAGWRRQFTHVIRFAPCSLETIRFNPVMAIRDGDQYAFRDANLIADILFAPVKSGGTQTEAEEYFTKSAKDMLTTAILHTRFCDDCRDKSLSAILRYLSCSDYRTLAEKKTSDEGSDQGQEQFLAMIKARHYYRIYNKKKGTYNKVVAENLHGTIVAGASRLISTNPKEKASVFKTVFTKLQDFEDPVLAASTSGSDFEIEDFINSSEPISLYLTVPYSDVHRVSAVFRMLISFMLKKFSEGETQYGAVKLKNHLLFLLDEFPTLGNFPDIAENMGVLRGYGVNFLIVCQTLKQLTDVYGVNNPFMDHCAVKIICAPNSVSDAKEFCDVIGQESICRERISRSGHRFTATNSLNVNDDDMGRALLDPSDIMRLPGDKCLVLAHTMQPYIAEKVVYYQDKRFCRKLNYKAPQTLNEFYAEITGLPSRKRIRRENLLKKKHMNKFLTEAPGQNESELFTTDEDEALLFSVSASVAKGLIPEAYIEEPSKFAINNKESNGTGTESAWR